MCNPHSHFSALISCQKAATSGLKVKRSLDFFCPTSSFTKVLNERKSLRKFLWMMKIHQLWKQPMTWEIIYFPTLVANCIFIDKSQPQLDKFKFGQHSGKRDLKVF